MDSIKNAIALLTTERAATNGKLKCIDAAIAALRIGQGEAQTERAPAKTRAANTRFKTKGMYQWVRSQIDAMPEGHEFSTRDLMKLLPGHLVQARHFLTLPMKSLPVDQIGGKRGPHGFTTYRKRVTTNALAPIQHTNQLAVA